MTTLLAYLAGVLSGVALVVLALLGGLAWVTARCARQAELEREMLIEKG